MTDAENGEIDLSKLKTMRDVFDYCTKNKLHSVAQGMIELPPPTKLREISSKALLDPKQFNIHQYRNRFGEPVFVNAIQTLLKKHYHVDVTTDCILTNAGVTGGIVAALLAQRKRGKRRTALIEPFYTYHSKQSEEVFEVAPDVVPSHPDNFSPDWNKIETKLKAGLDTLIFCNPGNPSGRCWKQEEVERLVQLCEQHQTLLIIDEIYCDMVFEGHKHYSPINNPKGLSDYVVVCRGFSKTLAVQSWRIGYSVSTPKNIAEMMTHHDPIYISVPWMQHTLATYLNEDYDDFVKHIAKINAMLQHNWKVLSPAFQQALGWEPIEPSGSMYGMFLHKDVSDIAALQKGLKRGVGVAPASMFYGGEPANTRFIRIHLGMSEEKAQSIANTLLEKSK